MARKEKNTKPMNKVSNFSDFCKTCEEPKLKKINRQTKPNSVDQQQHIGNFTQKFNPVTRKIDYMSPAEVKDRIEAIEDMKESVSTLKIKGMVDIACKYDSKSTLDFDDRGVIINGDFSNMSEGDISLIEKKGGEVTDNMIIVQSY